MWTDKRRDQTWCVSTVVNSCSLWIQLIRWAMSVLRKGLARSSSQSVRHWSSFRQTQFWSSQKHEKRTLWKINTFDESDIKIHEIRSPGLSSLWFYINFIFLSDGKRSQTWCSLKVISRVNTRASKGVRHLSIELLTSGMIRFWEIPYKHKKI